MVRAQRGRWMEHIECCKDCRETGKGHYNYLTKEFIGIINKAKSFLYSCVVCKNTFIRETV